uniref:Uncharacterized protein n=1 Tax=Amphimedon queenslandica TaxID=400682 RepID=A0A1X7VL59_AMPQE
KSKKRKVCQTYSNICNKKQKVNKDKEMKKSEKPKGSIIVMSDYDQPEDDDAFTATSTLAIN